MNKGTLARQAVHWGYRIVMVLRPVEGGPRRHSERHRVNVPEIGPTVVHRDTREITAPRAQCRVLSFGFLQELSGRQGHGGIRGTHPTTKAYTPPPHNYNGGFRCPHPLPREAVG